MTKYYNTLHKQNAKTSDLVTFQGMIALILFAMSSYVFFFLLCL